MKMIEDEDSDTDEDLIKDINKINHKELNIQMFFLANKFIINFTNIYVPSHII